MAVTILTGLVDEQDVLSNEKVVDMSDEIKLLDPEVSQFSTIAMKAASKPAFNPKVEWLEDQLRPRVTTLSASATSAATTVSVATDTGQYFRAGDVIRFAAAGDAATVDSVSTDTLTVTRGLGGVTAASSQSGLEVVIVGNAAVEGATLGTRQVTKKVAGFNYEQILRTPFGFTETYLATKTYGPAQPGYQAAMSGTQHKREIESTLFWGARDISTPSTPLRTCGGMVEFISTNSNAAGGALTSANLDLYLEAVLAHGEQDSKVLFCAPRVATAISGFLKTAWAPNTTNDKLFGAFVNGYVSGTYGSRIPVIVKREWSDQSTASSQYGSQAIIVDLSYVYYRPLRATRYLTNRQANDADEVTNEYLTEFSLQVCQESVHAKITGVTS